MKKLLKEFKDFALRGNVIDLAVGVIIGAAFQAIVKSLTDDILTPLIGLLIRTDLTSLSWTVFGVSVNYGNFLTAIINFIIMAFVIFLLIKGINSLSKLGKKPEAPAEPAPAPRLCPYCYAEIHAQATRCPHCTSELPAAEESAE